MELPIIILLVSITIVQLLLTWSVLSIEKKLDMFSLIGSDVVEEAKVTDPFTKPREIYSSTSHIVVPKTPTEIRNQNFDKIKKGIEYGDIDRG